MTSALEELARRYSLEQLTGVDDALTQYFLRRSVGIRLFLGQLKLMAAPETPVSVLLDSAALTYVLTSVTIIPQHACDWEDERRRLTNEYENRTEAQIDFDPCEVAFTWIDSHTLEFKDERMRILCMYLKKTNLYRDILLKPKPSRTV